MFASDIWIGIIPGALLLSGHKLAAAANEVFGGIVATGFGSVDAVLHIRQEFRHPHNVLSELWEGPAESQLFPPSVWRFLNGPSEEDPSRTIREVLLNRWRAEHRVGGPESEPEHRRTVLFVGDGGRYGRRELRIRAEMLSHLGSEVLRLGQAIHRLKYEVTQWLETLVPLTAAMEERGSGEPREKR